jgi:hypothetical protein
MGWGISVEQNLLSKSWFLLQGLRAMAQSVAIFSFLIVVFGVGKEECCEGMVACAC